MNRYSLPNFFDEQWLAKKCFNPHLRQKATVYGQPSHSPLVIELVDNRTITPSLLHLISEDTCHSYFCIRPRVDLHGPKQCLTDDDACIIGRQKYKSGADLV